MVLLILTLTFLAALVAGIVISIVRRSENWYTATLFIAICWIILGFILAMRGVLAVPNFDVCRIVDVKLPEYAYESAEIRCEVNPKEHGLKKFIHIFYVPTGEITGFDASCQAKGRDCRCVYVERHFWLGEYSLKSETCPPKHEYPYQPPAEQP